jgi:hypothetical protein
MGVAECAGALISTIQKSRSMTGTDTLHTGTSPIRPSSRPAWA